MPLFGLGKQRFNPDLALADRLRVGGGRLVGLHALHVLLAKGAANRAPRLRTRCAVGLEGAGAAARGPCAVADALLDLGRVYAAQYLAVRAHIAVALGV